MARTAILVPLLLLAPGIAGAQMTNDDYPASALRAGHEGTAEFRVEINLQGRAENCVITKSSGWDDLDEATCRLMTIRGRFEPARDQAGKPTRGTYASRIVWKLPN